jgi:hypothetical protein
MKYFGIHESEEVCANCRFYCQHYVYGAHYKSGYAATHCGHCHYPQLKHRDPGQTCARFESNIGVKLPVNVRK